MNVRCQKVAETILRELALMMTHGEIRDPRLTGVTITEVTMSPDLQHASVYFNTATGSAGAEEAVRGFHKAAGYIRTQIGKRVKLRLTPELAFHYDASRDYGERMDRILDELKRQRVEEV